MEQAPKPSRPQALSMTVTFPSGDLSLEGALVRSPGSSQAAVVCHPHPQCGGDMNNSVVRAVAGSLERAGYATLRFNFRGVGRSDGRYAGGVGEIEDARAAVRYVMESTGVSQVVLAGYSFGALVALQAGVNMPEVDRLIAVAVPLDGLDVSLLASCAKEKAFIVGDGDAFCRVAKLQEAMAHLSEPKTIRVISGADHFFYGHEQEIAAAVNAFVSAGSADQRS